MKIDMQGTVVVPELEEQVKRYALRSWTEEEIAIVRSYYGRIATVQIQRYLAKHFPPGRSTATVSRKAKELGFPTYKERHSKEK